MLKKKDKQTAFDWNDIQWLGSLNIVSKKMS